MRIYAYFILAFLLISCASKPTNAHNDVRYQSLKNKKIALGFEKVSTKHTTSLTPAPLPTPPVSLENSSFWISGIESKSEFYKYLDELSKSEARWSYDVYRLFRQIEKFPDLARYRGAEYEIYRKAFNLDCSNAAAAFNDALYAELKTGLDAPFNASLFASRANELNEFCLWKLESEAVPVEVKAVTGIFVAEGEKDYIFCSGTIVGPNKVVTSKHCFIDPSSAKKTDFYNYLLTGKVSFYNFSSDGAVASNRVAFIQGETDLKLKKYDATEDKVYLGLVTSVTKVASINEQIPAGRSPIAAYLLGNSDLAENDGSGSKFARARASIPNSCAIVEITSNGCAYHTCQAGESTSGGGLLTIDANKNVSLIAVHKGGIGRSEGCEIDATLRETSGLNLNVATIP